MIRLNDIYTSIQGEGAHTGVPMIVVRTQGCGVGCPFCDTKETWASAPEGFRVEYLEGLRSDERHWADVPVATAVEWIKSVAEKRIRHILLTGGEPLEQPGSTLLAYELSKAGFDVHLETSGTTPDEDLRPFEWVTVSPKLNMPGGRKVIPAQVRLADEVKWVVGKQADLDVLRAFIGEHRLNPECVWLQPMSQSRAATELCVASCLSNGYRLSLQMHKYIGVE